MGKVTDIKHVAGKSPVIYPKGDQVFEIGTVLRSPRGWPGTIITTDRNDYLADFGTPDRNSEDGYQAKFALYNHANTVGKYVRVVSDTAEYPYFSFQGNGVSEEGSDWVVGTTYAQYVVVTLNSIKYVSQIANNTGNDPSTDGGSNWVPLIDKSSATFATVVNPAGDISLIFMLINGEVRDNYFGLSISNKNATKQTFDVSVWEDQANPVQVGETMTASLNVDAIAADQSSLFIESVLANKSEAVGVKMATGASFDNIFEHDVVWFSGGNDTATPSPQNYSDAWDLLRSSQVDLDLIFMAGDATDANVQVAAAIAIERDIRLEGDCPAGLSVAAAIVWVNGLGIQTHNVSFTYGQISFNDPFYTGMRKYLRISGFLAASKAYGREASKTIIDPGIEEAPAGEEFGLIRGVSGIKNETTLSVQDKKDLAGAWINYIVNGADKGVIIWEQFTMYGEECNYAYKRNVDVINYIYHIHAQLMQKQQFRGKSDREIIKTCSKVLKRLQTKGVLVPDETNEEFSEAYKVWITRTGSTVEINRMIRIQYAIGPIVLKTIPY